MLIDTTVAAERTALEHAAEEKRRREERLGPYVRRIGAVEAALDSDFDRRVDELQSPIWPSMPLSFGVSRPARHIRSS